MKIALFYHSLVSDWNHGNAHFLRGIASELLARGHDVIVCEPEDSWSYQNLVQEYGETPVQAFSKFYPQLVSHRYQLTDVDALLDGTDLAIVHEWSSPELVAAVGRWRAQNPGARLLFHDTHHRAATAPHEIAKFDLQNYDGVLAYGQVLRSLYEQNQWARRVWTWHEAADVRVFHPYDQVEKVNDVAWIGNWGDGERTEELHAYLIDPCRRLGLRGVVHGVRYPQEAKEALAAGGLRYAGWIPNFRAPEVFASSRLTIHVPRGPYVRQLPGIPTIRPFEALACGIPLVSAPWQDTEGLFRIGTDFLMAHSREEMIQFVRAVLFEPGLARSLATHGRETILARHTCAHRVDELMEICRELGLGQFGSPHLRVQQAVRI